MFNRHSLVPVVMGPLAVLIVVVTAIWWFGVRGTDTELAPRTVTVSLEGLEGFVGIRVHGYVLPATPSKERQVLGLVRIGTVDEDPFSAAAVMHLPGEQGWWDGSTAEVAILDPGTYRFILEAYAPTPEEGEGSPVPATERPYGCETVVSVAADEPLIVTISSVPRNYSEGSLYWTPYDELKYPDCP
jgi:hypothetical protein